MSKRLVGVMKSSKAFGLIKTRFFFIDAEKQEVKDVTLELCHAIDKFNEKAKKVRETGKYAMIIPYDYKDGLAVYSHGCGNTHYFGQKVFGEVANASDNKLSFPLTECETISIYTPGDVKHILGIKGPFDLNVESALANRYFLVEQ